MKSFQDYLSPLLSQIPQKQVRENVISLLSKFQKEQTGQLWSVSTDGKEYARYRSMLDGSLKTIVDVKKLNISMLLNSCSFFESTDSIMVIHDGSDIRKPYSKQLENLDTVRSLDGKLINGYPTFNSIGVDLKGKGLRLLQSSPYSHQDALYLSTTDIADYHANLLLSARRAEVKLLLESGNYYNEQMLVEDHVREIDFSVRAANPQLSVIHVYDRGHDSQSLFEYHQQHGSLFVSRLKCNRLGNEVFINSSGKERSIKLVQQQMFESREKRYERVRFKERTYHQVHGVFEWCTLDLGDQTYAVVRVQMFTRKGQRIFRQPMLLLTNMEINMEPKAELVFEIYMKRNKIEGVFKFCKDKLGWESFQIRQFEAIKNLLALVYFLAGYFYELEDEIVQHPAAQWLAYLGNGKGKVTIHFLLKGLAKLIQFFELQKQLEQDPQLTELALNAMEIFASKRKKST